VVNHTNEHSQALPPPKWAARGAQTSVGVVGARAYVCVCVCIVAVFAASPSLPARVLVWCACVEGARWRARWCTRSAQTPCEPCLSHETQHKTHIHARPQTKTQKKSQWSAGTRPRSHSLRCGLSLLYTPPCKALVGGLLSFLLFLFLVVLLVWLLLVVVDVCRDVAVVDGADVVVLLWLFVPEKGGAGDDACTREGAREQRREGGSEEEEEEWCYSLDSLHRGCGHTLSPPVLSRRGAYSLPVRKAM